MPRVFLAGLWVASLLATCCIADRKAKDKEGTSPANNVGVVREHLTKEEYDALWVTTIKETVQKLSKKRMERNLQDELRADEAQKALVAKEEKPGMLLRMKEAGTWIKSELGFGKKASVVKTASLAQEDAEETDEPEGGAQAAESAQVPTEPVEVAATLTPLEQPNGAATDERAVEVQAPEEAAAEANQPAATWPSAAPEAQTATMKGTSKAEATGSSEVEVDNGPEFKERMGDGLLEKESQADSKAESTGNAEFNVKAKGTSSAKSKMSRNVQFEESAKTAQAQPLFRRFFLEFAKRAKPFAGVLGSLPAVGVRQTTEMQSMQQASKLTPRLPQVSQEVKTNLQAFLVGAVSIAFSAKNPALTRTLFNEGVAVPVLIALGFFFTSPRYLFSPFLSPEVHEPKVPEPSPALGVPKSLPALEQHATSSTRPRFEALKALIARIDNFIRAKATVMGKSSKEFVAAALTILKPLRELLVAEGDMDKTVSHLRCSLGSMASQMPATVDEGVRVEVEAVRQENCQEFCGDDSREGEQDGIECCRNLCQKKRLSPVVAAVTGGIYPTSATHGNQRSAVSWALRK